MPKEVPQNHFILACLGFAGDGTQKQSTLHRIHFLAIIIIFCFLHARFSSLSMIKVMLLLVKEMTMTIMKVSKRGLKVRGRFAGGRGGCVVRQMAIGLSNWQLVFNRPCHGPALWKSRDGTLAILSYMPTCLEIPEHVCCVSHPEALRLLNRLKNPPKTTLTGLNLKDRKAITALLLFNQVIAPPKNLNCPVTAALII